MPRLVEMIQTTWPDIRVGLYRHEDGRYQFVEEARKSSDSGDLFWSHFHRSQLYDDIAIARIDMLADYCGRVEDEYCPIDPAMVKILNPPDGDTARSGFDDPEFGKGDRIIIRADPTETQLETRLHELAARADDE